MYERVSDFQSSLLPIKLSTIHRKTPMPTTSKIKEAVVTTAVVLAVIYSLNQLSFTRGVVQKALTGA